MGLFKSWDELTLLEQLYSEYSDTYKDVNGFRPRSKSIDEWTEKGLQEELDYLYKQSEVQISEKIIREEAGVKNFYNLLKDVANLCNTNLTGAMKYLIESEGDDWYDWGYYCMSNDLPFSFKPEGVNFKSLGIHYHLWK